MSYLVLARKYRPQTFEEVVSQKHITATLQNAIRQQRFSHAYLFTGTRGTGKTTVARILAKALNCETGPTPTPCNQCVHCKQINNSSGLDVIEVDAASNTGVDNIRDLRESVRYAPASARYKIYIIDEVHRLSGPAFDALLKTLEEPPAHVIFIFATTDPQKLPATIISRCQRYDFRRIPYGDLRRALREIAEKEKIEIDDEAVSLIAQKGDGSLRDALSIFEQVMAYSDRKITRETIADSLGLVDLELLFDLTDCLLAKDVNRALEITEKMLSSGVDVAQFIGDFQEHFRKILIINSSETPSDYLAVSDYFQGKYLGLKGKFSDSDLFRNVKLLSDLQYDLKSGADPALFLEVAILRLVKMESSVLLEDVLKKISQMNQSSGGRSEIDLFAPPPKANPGADHPDQSRSIGNPNAGNSLSSGMGTEPRKPDSPKMFASPVSVSPISWKMFVDLVKGDNPMLGQFLGHGELTRLDEQAVELTYLANGGVYQQHVAKLENQKIMEKQMKAIFGRTLRIITKIDKSRMADLNDNPENQKYDVTPEELFQKKPDLKKLADSIGGKIRSIKVIGNKGDADAQGL